jgi:hypothetical protein
MRLLAVLVATCALLTAVPSVAGAAPTYCYAAKPGAEGGCMYKATAPVTVRLTGGGGWNVLVKHKKKVRNIASPNPEVPTTFELQLTKGDTVTLGITHIGSAIVLTTDE